MTSIRSYLVLNGATMTKWERIQHVKSLGLNTENSVLITTPEFNPRNYEFLNSFYAFSVRSFFKDESNPNVAPHWPVVSRPELFALVLIACDKQLNLIVAECIDPKDALFAGAALKRDCGGYSNLHIELARGPGTVRRVTNDHAIDIIYSYQERSLRVNTHHMMSMYPNRKIESSEFERQLVHSCARTFEKIEQDDIIFEFSYYNVPVGYQHTNAIVWEITPADRR